jgi:hypothetical protein
MPAGLPYFAWVDPGETTFAPEHLRWDENIFSFTLKQDEGDPASLTLVVRRPRNDAGNAIGLLGPGRKIWAWFAMDCGPDLIRFRGRLVGVPTSIFEELVTLEFVARPIDLVAQKEALAQTLRVLPYYDEVVIDPARRTDPEVVLEGYSAIWHYGREDHVLSVSDEITGEDGLVEFDGASEDGKVLYDGLGLTLTSGPLARVDVKAEYTWTQQAQGTVDLTQYLIRHWPGSGPNYITSLTMTADSWPKAGAGIGDGWTVAAASAFSTYDYTVQSKTVGLDQKVVFPTTTATGDYLSATGGGSTTTTTYTETTSFVNAPVSLTYPEMITQDSISVATTAEPGGEGVVWASTYTSSYSRNWSAVGAVVPLNYITFTMLAGYTANRQCTELVSFSLYADVQHVLTDPEDGEALRVDDVKSVNLSEAIGEGSDAYVPIGDPRRRSYIATARGNQSLEHLIALARAHLMKRARVVEIAFAPKLSRMPEITLRKNAFLVEPRIGEALGKVIGYSLALDGSDGRVKCEIRIGCAIGRGGSAVAAGGEPTYCDVDYTGADYQQFTGRTVLFDTSVGYQPPAADPNDDGINFLSALTAEDVIDIPLIVENPASVQADYVWSHAHWLTPTPIFELSASAGVEGEAFLGTTDEQRQAAVAARAQSVNNALNEVPTKASFKLKSMSRQFSSDYPIQVTDVKIPTGYDLSMT